MLHAASLHCNTHGTVRKCSHCLFLAGQPSRPIWPPPPSNIFELQATDKALPLTLQLSGETATMSKLSEAYYVGLQAIEEALAPRLQLSGETAKLNKFKQFFEGKTLEKGSDVVLLWNPSGRLDVKAGQAGDSYDRVSPARLQHPDTHS